MTAWRCDHLYHSWWTLHIYHVELHLKWALFLGGYLFKFTGGYCSSILSELPRKYRLWVHISEKMKLFHKHGANLRNVLNVQRRKENKEKSHYVVVSWVRKQMQFWRRDSSRPCGMSAKTKSHLWLIKNIGTTWIPLADDVRPSSPCTQPLEQKAEQRYSMRE